MPEALAYIQRGKVIESIHYGDIAVVDHRGEIIFSKGDPNNLIYLRSAAKPLQAAAALLKNVDTEYGLTHEEIAFLCASHSGEEVHINVANKLIDKLGIKKDELNLEAVYPIN